MSSRLDQFLNQAYGVIPPSVPEILNNYQKNTLGGPLSESDIIDALKNPYSRLSQEVKAFVIEDYWQKFIARQQYLDRLMAAETADSRDRQINAPSAKPFVDLSDEDMPTFAPAPKPQSGIDQVQAEMEKLAKLFETYKGLKKQLIEQRAAQKEEVNAAFESITGFDRVYIFTDRHQQALEKAYKTPEQKKVEKITRQTVTLELAISKVNISNELNFMSVMTERAENNNLKPSEVKALAKSGAFQVYDKYAKEIHETRQEMKACERNIIELSENIERIMPRADIPKPPPLPASNRLESEQQEREKQEAGFTASLSRN